MLLFRAVMVVGAASLGIWCARAQDGAGCVGPPELRAAAAEQQTEEAYNALGYWFTENGQLSCAVGAFRSAVDLNGESAGARYNLGIALYESGDDEGAATHLKEAARLAPGEPSMHQALGAALLRLKRWDEAEAAFRTALQVAPDSKFAQEGLTRAQRGGEADAASPPPASVISVAAQRMREGDFSGAVQAYQTYLRTTPDNALVRYNLAMALLKTGHRDDARKQLQEAIRLKPDFAAAQNHLGVLHQEEGRSQQAERFFRQAIESDPRHTLAYLNLGLTLAGQQRFAESEMVFRKARGLAPDNPAVLTALGMSMVRQQHLEDALEVLQRALELQPRSAVAHMNVGVAMADLSWQARALEHFDEAVRLKPDLAEAHYNRGRAIYELGRLDEAKASLEQALLLQPGHAPALMMLGMAEIKLERPGKAVELLQRSVSLEPSNTTAQHKLGAVLLALGREEEGVEHLKAAVELDSNNHQAVYALMRVLGARKAPEAKQYGQQLREMKRREMASDRAGVLSNFALDAAKAEDWPKAISQLREAIDVCGKCSVQARLHKNLGLIMAQSGDNTGAVDELAIAHDLSPEDRDIEYALDLMKRRVPPSAR